METINQVLKVLFQEERSEDVIDRILLKSSKYSDFDSLVDSDIFARQLLHVDAAKTLDHAAIIYNVLRDKWSKPNPQDYSLMYCKQSNLFNALLHFTSDKLAVDCNMPVCRYTELLSWHEITRDFGEDMCVTAHLAAYDLRNGFMRDRFDWNCYLDSDASELHELFSKNMFDLHAHLYGSSLNFELNWLCLMNHLGGHEANFAQMDASKVFPSMSYRLNTNGRSLYVKVLCAAMIRLYLYLDMVSEDWSCDIQEKLHIYDTLACHDLLPMLSLASTAQEYIDALAFSRARKYIDAENQTKYIPDYAISGEDKRVLSVLGGERRLMYQVFRKIYSGAYTLDRKTALFYIYLLIKEELRKEMVQTNHAVGFENFSEYQNRKCMFINQGSVYERLLSLLAVGTYMDGKGERYLEMRIAPRKTMKDDVRQIEQNDLYITNSTFAKNLVVDKDDFYYIFHFIKLKDYALCDNCCLSEFSLSPRHHKLRCELERQAKAISELMHSDHEAAKRLVGIDAANSEIFCRPEVFARVYRYLSLQMSSNTNKIEHKLGMTYHVGEDFYDVVDGLRAVSEVLTFLQFQHGSRLGHALVLGVDVAFYYKHHDYRVNATKQVLLDNVAWLYVQAQRLGCCTTVQAYLQELYSNYFHQVFSKELQMSDVYTYYQSWLLRGDSPYCYMQKDTKVKAADIERSDEMLDSWNKVVYNHSEEVDCARRNEEACKLYWLYHYDMVVRIRGAESEVMVIKPEYRNLIIQTIQAVQQRLLDNIERLHIAIECNPSSNYKIGEIQRYDEHPIIKFNNYGLSSPHPRHAISVSINTDDAGVFSTSLEREYSLMALAMEKHEDENYANTPRDVIEWLNHIRLMTKEQKFHKDN